MAGVAEVRSGGRTDPSRAHGRTAKVPQRLILPPGRRSWYNRSSAVRLARVERVRPLVPGATACSRPQTGACSTLPIHSAFKFSSHSFHKAYPIDPPSHSLPPCYHIRGRELPSPPTPAETFWIEDRQRLCHYLQRPKPSAGPIPLRMRQRILPNEAKFAQSLTPSTSCNEITKRTQTRRRLPGCRAPAGCVVALRRHPGGQLC